jgi:hypothetical protein
VPNPSVSVATDPNQPPFSGEFARLKLHRDPSAASAGSTPRQAAEAALPPLVTAVGEDGYAAKASARLFPPGDDAAQLVATRDWVLFRRRAVLRCGGTVSPGPPPPAVKTIRVDVVGIDNDSWVAYRTATEPMPTADAIAQFFKTATILGGVTFPEGSATPSNADELMSLKAKFEAGPAVKPVERATDAPPEQPEPFTVESVDVYTVSDVPSAAARAAAIAAAMVRIVPPYRPLRALHVDASDFDEAWRQSSLSQPTLVVLVRYYPHK